MVVALHQKVRELNGGDEMTGDRKRNENDTCSFVHPCYSLVCVELLKWEWLEE